MGNGGMAPHILNLSARRISWHGGRKWTKFMEAFVEV